jgi:hypothetical protein
MVNDSLLYLFSLAFRIVGTSITVTAMTGHSLSMHPRLYNGNLGSLAQIRDRVESGITKLISSVWSLTFQKFIWHEHPNTHCCISSKPGQGL